MNIRQRLKKLEAVMIKPELIKIAHFIVEPGKLELKGYRCGDVAIIRKPGGISGSI